MALALFLSMVVSVGLGIFIYRVAAQHVVRARETGRLHDGWTIDKAREADY